MAMKSSSVQRLPADMEGVLAAIEQPASIAAACHDIEVFLSRNREHARSFFRSVFPVLLRKLFGFEDSLLSTSAAFSAVATSAGGWIAAASRPGSEADAKALVALLSPTSTLFQKIY